MTRLETEHIYRIDLNQGTLETELSQPLMHLDAQADVFTAVLRRGMSPVNLTGASVFGYLWLSATQQTLVLTGSTQGSEASVTLTEDCCAQPGRFSLALQVTLDDVRHTVLKINGTIERTSTDSIASPDDTVPTLPDLLEQISALKDVTAEAQTVLADVQEAISNAHAAAQTALASAAPPIPLSAEGSVVTLTETADNRPLTALQMFGYTALSDVPAPDAPIDLVSAASGGSVALRLTCSNLLNIHSFTPTKDAVVVIDGDDSLTVSGAQAYANARIDVNIAGLAGCTLWLHGTVSAAPAAISPYYIIDGVSKYLNPSVLRSGWQIPHGAATMRLQLLANNTAAELESANTAVFTGLALTLDEHAPSGAYHAPQSMSIALPGSLCGVPVSSSGTYTDTAGQQWIADEIDPARGVYVQRVKTHVLDGTETWLTWGADSHTSGLTGFYTRNVTDYLPGSLPLCSHLPARNSVYNGSAEGVALHTSGAYLMLCIPTALLADPATPVESLKTYLGQQAAAGSPVTVQYALAEPIETALASSEIASFAALRTCYAETILYNSAGAHMHLTCAADTKLYIDQQLRSMLSSV
ncbi:MAG: hypothetical protein IJZ74_07225 [Clostridia bacterium]|nr:hypothetical protein [Clostridia bacterium]